MRVRWVGTKGWRFANTTVIQGADEIKDAQHHQQAQEKGRRQDMEKHERSPPCVSRSGTNVPGALRRFL